MKFPLEGIRVLELARVLAGPWVGQSLSDLGADVIKIESPKGDETRKWGPPFIDGEEVGLESAYFHSCNRGKRSLVLDFKNKKDLQILYKLIQKSDVIIENFKVGGLNKYNLDYPSVSKLNPGIIYCSITGFGQTGPYAERLGYDFIIQALSGIMDLTGEPDGEPQKMGVAFADIFTGLYGVIAIQSALKVREYSQKGQHIDLSLMDSMVAVLANQASNYFVSGKSPKRMGNKHPNIVPYQVFQVKDGHLIIAVGNNEQFERFCKVIGLDYLYSSEEYNNNQKRVQNREKLVEIITSKTKQYNKNDLKSLLEENNVPVGSVNDIEEVFNDPQVKYRKLKINMTNKNAKKGYTQSIRTPILFSDTELDYSRGVPMLGEHNNEILKELDNES